MIQIRRLLAGLPLLLSLGAPPGHADLAADCSQSRHLELQIKACTILIEDRALAGGNLALAHVNRANAYGMLRRYRQALDDYAAAIALEPHDALAYYNRANIHFDLGNSADAIADYTRAIDADAAFTLAYFNRGLAREGGGDRAGAIADYRRALQLEPSLGKAASRLRGLRADVK